MAFDPNPYAALADAPPPPSAQAEVVPQLWNPTAAANWSLLFTPIFGAYLHMLNWQALGEPDRARNAKAWFVASIVVYVMVIVLGSLAPEEAGNSLSRVGGFVLLLSWYFASGKRQIEFVKGRYGTAYPRRSWGMPLLLGFGSVAALIGVGIAIMVATDATR